MGLSNGLTFARLYLRPVHHLGQGAAEAYGGRRSDSLLAPVEDALVVVLPWQPWQPLNVQLNLIWSAKEIDGRID